MKPSLTTVVCLLFLALSCSPPDQANKANASLSDKKSLPDELPVTDFKPVFGYRFVIEGDFDGDGTREKLTEHFVDRRNGKESDKFYEDADYGQLIRLTAEKELYSFMLADSSFIDTLLITADGLQTGLSYARNEGDLNGDGTDELSYVIDWTDFSNFNTWYIVTYRHGRWERLYTFDIWDWQLPDVPQTANGYGLFGTMDKAVNPNADSIIRRQTEDLNRFPGLVKKLNGSMIQVTYRNAEAMEDTLVVDLGGK